MSLVPDLNAPIGVFDSGVGGLSVLRALCGALPLERFIYFADSAHAPYGEKGDAFVLQRSLAIAQQLIQTHGIKALVVACNTATAAAIAALRSRYPDLIIIGIEPALKPAAALSLSKQIAVLATRGTLVSDKFNTLLSTHAATAQFVCQPCDALAEAIETHIECLNNPEIRRLVRYYLDAIGLLDHSNPIDTLVLGCTHYPLIKSVFQSYLSPAVNIVDNGAGVANQLALRLRQSSLQQVKPLNEAPIICLSSAKMVPNWQSVLAQ